MTTQQDGTNEPLGGEELLDALTNQQDLMSSVFGAEEQPAPAAQTSTKEAQNPLAEVKGIINVATAAGKKANVTDMLTPCIEGVLTMLTSLNQRVIHTENEFWLYTQSLGYWKRVSPTFIEQVFDRMYRQIANMAPTIKFVAEVVRGVQRRVHIETPPWRDQTKNQLLFKNGIVVDMDTGITLAPAPDNWLREADVVDSNWDTTATCPLWDKTINDIMQHVDATQRQATIDLIEEWMGSSLFRIRRPRAISKCMILFGKKRTGKSTILDALRSVWGSSHCAASSMKDLAGPFGLQPFLDKALWLSDESPDKARMETEFFKRLVTNEPVTVNIKHQPSWTGRLNLTLGFAVNDPPNMGDSPDAVNDRIIWAPTDTMFDPQQQDPQLLEKLANERDGILQKIWKAGLRLKQRGQYAMPPWLLAKQDDIQIEQDPLRDFCANAFDMGSQFANSFVRISDIISAFKGYMITQMGKDEARNRMVSGNFISRRLGEIMPSTNVRRIQHGTVRVRTGLAFNKERGLFWLDVGWKEEDNQYRTDQTRLAAANGQLGQVVNLMP